MHQNTEQCFHPNAKVCLRAQTHECSSRYLQGKLVLVCTWVLGIGWYVKGWLVLVGTYRVNRYGWVRTGVAPACSAIMRLDRGAGGRAGQSGKGLIYSTLHAPNLVGEPGEIRIHTFLVHLSLLFCLSLSVMYLQQVIERVPPRQRLNFFQLLVMPFSNAQAAS